MLNNKDLTDNLDHYLLFEIVDGIFIITITQYYLPITFLVGIACRINDESDKIVASFRQCLT